MDNRRRQAICLFIDNYHDLKKHLFLKAPIKQLRLGSLILSLKGHRIDPDEFRNGLAYIKRHTQWYSPFRRFMVPAAAFSILPEKSFYAAFNRLAYCGRALKDAGFKPSSRTFPAAMALYAASEEGTERLLAERAFPVFMRMKAWRSTRFMEQLHVPAVLTAATFLSGKEPTGDEDLLPGSPEAWESDKRQGLHFLAAILTYAAGTPDTIRARCAELYAKLNRMNFKSPSMLYGTLGFLVLSGYDCERVIYDTLDTMGLLRLGKCFSGFEREQAMLVASALIAASRSEFPDESGLTPNPSIISAQAAACLL